MLCLSTSCKRRLVAPAASECMDAGVVGATSYGCIDMQNPVKVGFTSTDCTSGVPVLELVADLGKCTAIGGSSIKVDGGKVHR